MSVAVESTPTAATTAVGTGSGPERKPSLVAENEPEDDACPKCYRTKALHTNMKFMVSACGHKLYVFFCHCSFLLLLSIEVEKVEGKKKRTWLVFGGGWLMPCRCDHCMKRLLGASGVCVCYVPGCGTTLRQGQFQEQIFEDTGVQTEVTIRKRIVSEYGAHCVARKIVVFVPVSYWLHLCNALFHFQI